MMQTAQALTTRPWPAMVVAFGCYFVYALYSNPSSPLSGSIVRILVVGGWLFTGYLLCPRVLPHTSTVKAVLGASVPFVLSIPGTLVSASHAPDRFAVISGLPMVATYAFICGVFGMRAKSVPAALLTGFLVFVAQLAVDLGLGMFGFYGAWSMP